MITRMNNGQLEVLCCPATDRAGKGIPDVADPDVVGCGSSDIELDPADKSYDCLDCGIWFEDQDHGEWRKASVVILTDRELATVLAALRFMQTPLNLPSEILDVATDGGKLPQASNEEVDSICQRLNAGLMDHTPGCVLYLEMKYDDFEADGGQQTPSRLEQMEFPDEAAATAAADHAQKYLARKYPQHASLWDVFVEPAAVPATNPKDVEPLIDEMMKHYM